MNINKPYLIGETAFHHQGDFQFAKELINTGRDIGVDAIKFHLLLDIDNYFVKDHEAYKVIQDWLFTAEEWTELLMHNKACGLDSIILCNDTQSVDYVINLNDESIKCIEIHATGLNDYHLLKKASQFKGRVILGVGGSTIDEISFAIDLLNSNGKNDIFLMYGFQNYPTKYEDVNLKKMIKLKELFNLPVGYADHTDPSNELNEIISTMGITMNINVVEKHFTHVFGEKRIDAQAAIDIKQLKKVRTLMDVLYTCIGTGNLAMSEGELSYGNTGPMKKAIVARCSIQKGQVISLNEIAFKRTNESTYMLQKNMTKLIGLKASKDIKVDEFIDFSNVDYKFIKDNFDQFNANK